MDQFLAIALNVSVVVFAVASMLSAGLGQRVQDLVGVLSNPFIVLRVLLANFVLVPLLGFVLIRLLDPPLPLSFGLFLTASAAGASFLIKLTETADADVGLSTAMLVILLPATIVYMPFIVPVALRGAETSAAIIAKPLVLTMLLPLVLGMVLRKISKSWSVVLRPILSPISSIALLVLIATTVLANLPAILEVFTTTAAVAAVLLVGGAFVIGYGLAGPSRRSRYVLGLATAQRNISAAAVVATQALASQHAVTMVIVTSLIGFALLFPISSMIRNS